MTATLMDNWKQLQIVMEGRGLYNNATVLGSEKKNQITMKNQM